MSNNPVVHFEIYVADMDRAKAFYQTVFGGRLEHMPSPTPGMEMDMWAFPMDRDAGMSSYGSGGMLVKMEGFTPGAGGTLVYFGCDDCGVSASRVEPAGGRVERPRFSIGPFGFIALVSDTEGNMIGLHSMQ